MPLRPITCLMKVYSEEQYATMFLNGILFANSVSYFQQLEEGNRRRDADEGITTVPLEEGFRMELSTAGNTILTLGREDLAEAPMIRPNWFSALNLFCMHMVTGIQEENRVTLDLASPFGGYGIVILNVQEFLRRIQRATDRHNYKLSYKSVTYYDRTAGIHTNPMTLEPLFTKQNRYKEEQECRFVIDRGLAVPTPLKVEIGSIHDIAKYVVGE